MKMKNIVSLVFIYTRTLSIIYFLSNKAILNSGKVKKT